jgi:hypothetical protein
MAMRIFFLFLSLVISVIVSAQEERDTLLSRCPIYITDTVSANNFFLEFQPSTIKVYRVKGDLTIAIQQRDQFFTLFFNDKKLKDEKYKIVKDANHNNEVAAKYSFRSGQQVSYVDVSKGTVESSFDKEKDMWHLKVNGMIANLVERNVTWYRVRADLYIR